MKHSANASHRASRIISRLFDPIVVVVPLVYAAVSKSTLSIPAREAFLVVFWLGMVAPPVVLLMWAIRKKVISDWDVGVRSQRVKALAVLLVLAVFNLFLVEVFGDPFLLTLALFFVAWLAGFFLITLRWKISGHTGVNTLVIGLITLWFGMRYGLLFLLVPLVGWARVVGRNHTLAQAVGGIVYSMAFLGIYHYVLYQ